MTTDQPRHLPADLLPATCIVGRRTLTELLHLASACLGAGYDEIAARLADEIAAGQRVALYDPEWERLTETPG